MNFYISQDMVLKIFINHFFLCGLLVLEIVTLEWNRDLYLFTVRNLTHFQPMFHFYTPWKHQKSLIFIPIFSWTISHQLNIKSYQYRKFEQALFENVA